MAHSTRTPSQAQTEHYLVFRDETDWHGNLELMMQIEVPLYSQPDENGVELSKDKRMALAVARAVSRAVGSDESFVSQFEGERFAVMSEIGQDEFDWVEYEQNPAFDAVWDPEVDS